MIGAPGHELNTGIVASFKRNRKETKDCILRHGKPPQYFKSLGVFDNHVTKY